MVKQIFNEYFGIFRERKRSKNMGKGEWQRSERLDMPSLDKLLTKY